MRITDEKSVDVGSITAERALAAINGITRLLGRLQRRNVAVPLQRAATNLPLSERALIGLEEEVRRLSRERAVTRTENQLLHELTACRDATAAADSLLQRLVPERSGEVAVILDVTQTPPRVVAARGLTHASMPYIDLSPELAHQLEQQPWATAWIRQNDGVLVIQSGDENMETGLHGADTSSCAVLEHHASTETLHGARDREVWCIGWRDGSELAAVLVTSSLYPAAVPRDEQLGLLSRVGQSLAAQIAHARQLRQRDEELSLSREMLELRAITDDATDRPLKTVGRFLARLRESLDADGVAVFLLSRRTEDVGVPAVYSRKPLPASVVSLWQRHESKLAQYAITHQREHDFDAAHLRAIGIDTLLGSARVWPLLHEGRLLGTVVLTQRSAAVIPDRRTRLLEWSVELLAVTLRRVFDAATMRRLARYDGLTDLTNRRTFDTLLAGEVERVKLGLSPECSLLLTDLDRFKLVNDTHGHPAGDEVLRVVAQLLREHVGHMRVGERSVLARYGGEELAVLLPGVGLAGAMRLAEELRAAVEARSILFQGKSLRVTISIGAASCSSHGQSAAELVAAADEALYRAKSAGRNRVCESNTVCCLPGTNSPLFR